MTLLHLAAAQSTREQAIRNRHFWPQLLYCQCSCHTTARVPILPRPPTHTIVTNQPQNSTFPLKTHEHSHPYSTPPSSSRASSIRQTCYPLAYVRHILLFTPRNAASVAPTPRFTFFLIIACPSFLFQLDTCFVEAAIPQFFP